MNIKKNKIIKKEIILEKKETESIIKKAYLFGGIFQNGCRFNCKCKNNFQKNNCMIFNIPCKKIQKKIDKDVSLLIKYQNN